MAKVFYTKETQDYITGETTMKETYRKHTDNAEHFIRVYPEGMASFMLCSGAEKSVVLACLKYLEYNNNEFFLSPDRRAEISGSGDITIQTIASSVSKLMKKNIFIKKSGSSYILNPLIFFYGTENERKVVIKNTVGSKISGK